MTNREAIDRLNELLLCTSLLSDADHESMRMAIKALEKDKCSSCKHYDKDYGETCLNPEGTCRVFEYDRYEEAENE